VRPLAFQHSIRAAFATGAIWIATFASSSSAEVVQTPEGFYRCSAGNGQFTGAEVDSWRGSSKLSGRIRLVDEIADADWPGGGAIVFELEDGGNTGAFVMQSTSRPEMLDVIVKLPGVGNSTWLTEVPRDSWVSVTVSIDEKGILTVTGGENTRTIALENPKIVRRQFHCQSGTFEFDLTPTASLPANVPQIGRPEAVRD
jgi:hypothetical protein